MQRDSRQPVRVGEDGPALSPAEEAEARWLFSVAVTPHFANEFNSAIDHLKKAVELMPDEPFYAEALERAQRDQVEYQKVITGCLTADEEQLQGTPSDAHEASGEPR